MNLNLKLTLFLVCVLTASSLAQVSEEPGEWSGELKGRAKVIEFVRVYVRMNGINVGEKRVRIYTERYGEAGDLLEGVRYQEHFGYARTVYTRAGDKTSAEVAFFDTS